MGGRIGGKKPTKVPMLKDNRIPMAVTTSRIPVASIEMQRQRSGKWYVTNRRKVWSEQDGLCKACGIMIYYPSGFELDHIVPLIDGGKDERENMQALCVTCHAEKTKKEARARGKYDFQYKKYIKKQVKS